MTRRDPAPERLAALVETGDLDGAATLLTGLVERERRIPRPWLDAAIVRGRALLLTAKGDIPAALRAVEGAPGRAARWGAFDRARVLLVRGRLLRYFADARRAAAVYSTAEAALTGHLADRPLLTIFGARNDPLRFQPHWRSLFPHARQEAVPRLATGLAPGDLGRVMSTR